MKGRTLFLCVVLLCFAALGFGDTLNGVVTNATTGKPASGVAVTLLSLDNGMSEAGHATADARGRFSLQFPASGMPHLVRANHQSVSYFKMAPPGTTQVELQVFDAASKLDAISTSVQIMRLQSNGGALQVMELYAVQNQSQPPRTLAGSSTFEFGLPEGAMIVQAAARSPNGQPINTNPAPVGGKKLVFAFDFPLRPGETQFEIAYQLPYSGQATLQPQVLHDVQHFVAMVPKGMKFSANGGTAFSAMPDPGGSDIEVINNAKAGTPIAFTVSGTGTLALDSGAAVDTPGPAGGSAMGTGPGGGLGKPIDSPDPLSRYRWPLLGMLTLALVGGGFYITRQTLPSESASVPEAPVVTAAPSLKDAAPAVAASSSSLLAAIKEELFQLEVERQQGRISDKEYAQAKAALDHTLQRAVRRSGSVSESRAK